MNTPHRSGGHNQVPGGFENASWAEFLPELDIEFASRCAALNEPREDQAISHVLTMTVYAPYRFTRELIHNSR